MRRRIALLTLTLGLLAALFWGMSRPAIVSGEWQHQGDVGVRVDSLAIGREIPTGQVERPPAWATRFQAIRWVWAVTHRVYKQAPENHLLVKVEATVTGIDQLTGDDLDMRVDLERYKMGAPQGTGLRMGNGLPAISFEMTIPDYLPAKAIEIRVRDRWFRFPMK